MDGADLAIDRISDLPDPLITQILSLLDIREAVHTCILSKRWTNLWTYMATLYFNYHISGFDREDKFLRFVRGILNHRGFSPLDKFILVVRSTSRSNHRIVEECINHAVACMPRVIYIYMHMHTVFKLPDSLFNCGSVKKMLLFSLLDKYIWEPPQPKPINLPSLQRLELGCMPIKDGFIKMLLLGCPVLEELVLTRCFLTMNEINSNVLKKLTIRECLISLWAKSITLKNAPSLLTADLEIFYAYDGLNLLGGLPNVTNLRLYTTSRHVLGLLDKDIPNCPILNNLKSLELGELETSYGWNLVSCFLQHAPNLKKLVLNFHHTEVTAREALSGNFSFRHEFLEIVGIRFKNESEEIVSEVVMTLGALVKTIGKIIIL